MILSFYFWVLTYCVGFGFVVLFCFFFIQIRKFRWNLHVTRVTVTLSYQMYFIYFKIAPSTEYSSIPRRARTSIQSAHVRTHKHRFKTETISKFKSKTHLRTRTHSVNGVPLAAIELWLFICGTVTIPPQCLKSNWCKFLVAFRFYKNHFQPNLIFFSPTPLRTVCMMRTCLHVCASVCACVLVAAMMMAMTV